jgi:hypothetical protein
MAWPGIVWLHAHVGPNAAAADPGTRAVVAGIVTGHKSRPVTDVARQRQADAQHHRPDTSRASVPAQLRASRRADSSSRRDADRQVVRAS